MSPKFFSKRRSLIGTLLFVLLFWSSQASTTTMVFSDLERMIEISDIIVEGTVTSQKTYPSEALGHVVTTTTIKTKNVFYGEKQDTFSFTQWGGNYDGKMAHIPGDATFSVGENVILFLATPKNKNEKGHLFLSLLSQSKYSVSQDSNFKVVKRDLSDVAFMDPETSKYSKRDDDFFRYDAFVAELKTQVYGIKGGSK